MKKYVFAFCVGFGTLAANSSMAGPADDYVKGLIGTWKGGGTVTVGSKGRKSTLRCTSTNTLNEAKRTLSFRGRCASASATRPLRGVIRYSADGKRIESVSFKFTGRGSSTGASLRGKTLTVSGTAKDRETGKRVPGRSIIRGGGRAFTISIQSKPAGKWINNGSLKFRR